MMTFTRLAPVDVALKSVLVIQAAMPAAIFPIVVARAHHRRHADGTSCRPRHFRDWFDHDPYLDRIRAALDIAPALKVRRRRRAGATASWFCKN
jgi:hypothetical protein